MKHSHAKIVAAALLGFFAALPVAEANRLGQAAAARGGGGQQRAANIQRPAQRPANIQRPAQRPTQRPANVQRPAQRPANVQRPANIQRPANAGGGRLPAANKPALANRPSLPAHQLPSGSVHRPQLPKKEGRPALGDKLPGGVAQKLPGNAAAKLPGAAQKLPPGLKDRPNKPIDFGGLQQNRPKLPGNDKMAGLTDRLPANLERPTQRPSLPGLDTSKRPDFSQINRAPGNTRPGQSQLGSKIKDRRPPAVPPRDQLQNYPGLADKLDRRPGGYDKWQQTRDTRWNSWHDKRADRLDQFQANRNDRWDNIASIQNNRQDFFTNRREDWQDWANDVQDYRQDRAWEVLDNVRDYNANLFVPDWYYRNSWYGGYYYNENVNPWVWWRPAVWSGLASFLGGLVGSQLDRDYGTQVYYDKETVYVEGQPVASAPEYRQQALELAAVPAPEEPFAPAGQGDDAGWFPLGVWALTQEEKGDAVMFYQLAVNKEGEVSGAYSNVLTGETSPITGSVDFETQRVAWRTGESDSTAIEANLAGLTKEFTPVFVHYGTGQTQEWLLVRLEDPS